MYPFFTSYIFIIFTNPDPLFFIPIIHREAVSLFYLLLLLPSFFFCSTRPHASSSFFFFILLSSFDSTEASFPPQDLTAHSFPLLSSSFFFSETESLPSLDLISAAKLPLFECCLNTRKMVIKLGKKSLALSWALTLQLQLQQLRSESEPNFASNFG